MFSILLILFFFAVLAFICVRVRIGSRFHRGLTRAVCAIWALAAFSLIPGTGVGLNALNVACVSALGLPGLGLLAVLARMP